MAITVALALTSVAGSAVEPLSGAVQSQIEALMAEKEGRNPAQRKMDSQLVYLTRQKTRGLAMPGAPKLVVGVAADADDRVLVDVKATVSPALRDFITRSGGEIVSDVPAFDAMRVLVPVAMVEELAARADVKFVEPAAPVVTNFGLPVSEADRTHRAVTARTTLGADGTGIKIGVLSNGINSLAASKANGNLNATATFVAGQASTGDEGTAMMELIQDLLPGAQLIFATGNGGNANMANNILLLQAAGCSVIVDDLTYLNESPFQDQIISQAVTTVSNAGVMYFSSARNSGNKNDGTSGTWEGDFADGGTAVSPVTTAGNLHDFGGGTTFNTVTAAGSDRRVDFFWSDAVGASSNDYDLFVLDSTGASVLRSSTNFQTGTQDPYESTNTLNVGERIVIVKKTGAASRFLHLDTGRAALTINTAGCVRGHNAAGAANAFSVAATNVANSPSPNFFVGGATNPVETFSSDGPRRLFYQPNGTPFTPGNFSSSGGSVIDKPDITAADGAKTSVPGFGTFFGTSAAAPHAAAIAGMLRNYKPSLTPAQVRTLMTSTALDTEAAGFDRDSGSGIVMALAAMQAAGAPDVLTIAETGLDASGPTGGPFTPATGTYTLTNTSGISLNWTAATTQSWTSISPSSGTLGAGNSVVVTCSINSTVAASLAAGSFIDTVTITNNTSGFSRQLSANLVVITPPANQTVTGLLNDNSTSGNARAPITRYRFERGVYLITAAELAASGLTSGRSLQGIGWNYSTAPGLSGSAPLTIYLQNTADTTNNKSSTWTSAIAGMTAAHNATTTLPNVTGTFDITFSGGSAFTYTGGALYVAFDWGQYTGTLSPTAAVLCNSFGLMSGFLGNQDLVAAPTTLGPSNFRPETRFTFPFASAPAVTTPSSANIATTSATLGGNVTTGWGSAITARGIVYAKTSDNTNPRIGGSNVTVVNDAANTTGVFTENVSGLVSGTSYSFVAFATNGVGTTYTTPTTIFSTSAGTPTVLLSTANLAQNAPTMTIAGTNFSTTPANNTVAFNLGATGTVTAATASQLTVTFSTLPASTGNLTAVVTTNGNGSGSPVQVATVVGAPTVAVNTGSRAQNAPTVVITGSNFSATPANNTVAFNLGAVGSVTAATATQLTVTFSTLPTSTGNLTANVTVFGGSSGVTQVATIVSAPTVALSTVSRAQNAPTLTITGTNFSTTPANNTVAFNLGAIGSVTAATATQLTVTFSTPPTSTGSLTAVVTSNGGSSGAAVQVATVVAAPTVTVTTGSLAQNAPTVVITGTNFSTTPANNSVAFNLGAAGNVTAATATQLTVAFTTQPTATGNLTAVVTSNGGGSGAAAQVATVVGAPTVTTSTGSLAQNAPTVVITGTNFSTTPANNTVAFSLGAAGNVTAATATQLTVTFNTQPSSTGNLTANVTVFGGSSGATQVATIVSAPTVTANTANRAQSAPTLTIAGTNFSTTPANNTVAFNLGAIGNVTAATATQLTVTFSTPPTSTGNLTTVVTSNGGSSGGAVQVATIVSTPTVTVNTNSLAQNAPTLVIAGTNFSTTPANNTVAFNLGAAGNVTAASATQLTVTFTTQPTSTGNLTANVTVSGGSSGAAQVATVVAAPTVTTSTTNVAQSAATVTINGANFSTTPANNTVVFNLGAAGNVTAASATQLTVTFTSPPSSTGNLTANVTVFGGSSGATQVATIVSTPTVTANTANRAQNAPTLIIAGGNFSATPANNTVAFNLGAIGTVTAATTTQLTVTFSTTPTATGNLTAVVTSNGVDSGAAVQVATVVGGPTVTTNTASRAQNAPTLVITGTNFSTTPANNTVAFSLGAVGSVTAATGTQLTVTFSTPPSSTGNLTAVVTSNGGSSGAGVQVATVVAAPTVTLTSSNLAQNAPTVVITGTNFSTTPANNIVAFNLGAAGNVTAATTTQLTVAFSAQPSSTASLTAVVTSNGGSSGAGVQVATVVAAPTVTLNSSNLAQNAPTVVINGTNFSTTPANNTVAFDIGAAGNVTAATATQLTVTFTNQPTSTGVLTAVVTSNGGSSGAAVQVATVVGSPTVTANTNSLAQNAPTLVIAGTNFSTTPASNTVAFNLGAAGNVTAATATQLTITFTTQPASTGNLTANVTVFGGSTGASQVATIVGAPTVTLSTTNVAQSAPTITITGSNFSTTPANNAVVFNLGAVGNVTAASATQLTVAFTTPPTSTGNLTANVTVFGGSSGATQVATIVTPPSVAANAANRAQNAPTLVIAGGNFSATPASNTVAFNLGAVGSVTAASATQLTVTFSTAPTSTGNLTAVVTTNGVDSGAAVQVGTVVGAPTITTSNIDLAQNAPTIVISGTNFSTTPANNTVAFNLGAIGNVTAATATQLTVTFSTPPTSTGSLTANVTVFGGSTGATQVATIVSAPTVTANLANRAQNAPTLTINGTSFSTTPASNTVAFNLGAIGNVTAASATQLTVTFTTQPTSTENLTAVVTSNGGSSGAAAQVATIVGAPTVTASTANLAEKSAVIVINGSNFSTTPANNAVAFNLGGAGNVTAASATQLTVTFTIAPAIGNLTANATVFGGSSGATQVATVTAVPVVTATGSTLAYTENDAATAIDPSLTVTDADSTDLIGGTVAITSGFTNGQDVLAFATQGTITGNYNSTNGVLTLSGTASVSAYQAALRAVTYENSSDNPSTVTRTVTFSAGDGTASDTATRDIAITAVNDAPTLAAILDPPAINEDAALQTVNLGGIGAGGGETQTLSITASSDNLALIPDPTVNYASPNATGSLSFTPVAEAFGTATITVTVDDGAATNHTVVRTFTVTVNSVNDVPAFTTGPNVTVKKSDPAQTVSSWTTAISAGPANESTQTLTFDVMNDNAALFSAAPAIASNGTLTFTPATDKIGSAIVTVKLKDSGGTNFGGQDTSASQTFTITVADVNLTPSFTSGGDVSVPKNSAAYTGAWATDVKAGPPSEIAQQVDFLVSNDNGTLFSTPPGIAADGTLTFTPATDAIGSATVTVRIHDNGGTNDGGHDTSAAQTFKINVTTFATQLGTYNGLALPAATATPGAEKTGLIKLTLAKKGKFTGKLKLGGLSFTLGGTIDDAGQPHFGKAGTATLALKRKNASELTLSLQLAVAGTSDQLTGEVTDNGAPFATILADRALYTSKKQPAAPFVPVPPNLLGTYTVVFDEPVAPALPANGFPHGDGFGVVKVDKNGIAKITGTLADGSKVSYANALSKTNAWPLWAPFAKGTGALAGRVQFENKPDADLTGPALLWFKPPGAKLFPNGWPGGITTDLVGSAYVVPAAAAQASVFLGLGAADADGNVELQVVGGNLAAPGLLGALSIDVKNKVLAIENVVFNPAATDLKFSLTKGTGLFKGSFLHPVTNVKAQFQGVILQKKKIGSGYFIGGDQVGAVGVIPDDAPGVP